MSRHIRQGLLVVLLLTLVFTLGWTYDRQAAKQHQTEESYALPARYEKMKDGIMVFCYHRVLKDSMSTEIAQSCLTTRSFTNSTCLRVRLPSRWPFKKRTSRSSRPDHDRMVQSHRPVRENTDLR